MEMNYTLSFYLGIFTIICMIVVSRIAFFKYEEFLRAVRDTMGKNRMSLAHKREKPIKGIIWKKDLKKMNFLSINFKDYHIKDVSDLEYFKNVETIILTYMGDNEEDIGMYNEEHVLDNLNKVRDFNKLRRVQLYHLNADKSVKNECPRTILFIDQFLRLGETQMKLEYKKRIYWLLRFILIVCVVNVLTGFYEMCSTSKNANANQIIWKGKRYNKDETGYHSIDEIKYLVDIPTDCDVKDIWAVAGYYAKDDSECDTRLKELKNIYDEGGVKAVVDERVIYKQQRGG